MPVSDGSEDLVQGRRHGTDPNQRDRSQQDHAWHQGVHRNAKLTMISVATNRMYVRNLGDGQQRHQYKAHNRHRSQSDWLSAAIVLQMCP